MKKATEEYAKNNNVIKYGNASLTQSLEETCDI